MFRSATKKLSARTIRAMSSYRQIGRVLLDAPSRPVLAGREVITSHNTRQGKATIALMTPEDLRYVLSEWSLDEGWKPTQYSTEANFKADPSGYSLLFLDKEPIASLSAVRYPAIKMAYFGLYIVRSQYRGQGFGRLHFDAVAEPLKRQGYTLGLDATMNNIPFYNKSGFNLSYVDQTWSCNYTGRPLFSSYPFTIEPVTSRNFDALTSYDLSVFGCDRRQFLHNWVFKPKTSSYIANLNGRTLGYGVMSERVPSVAEEKTAGHRLAPLYADSDNVAEGLLQALLAKTKHNLVFIDAPQPNTQSAKLLTKYGFTNMWNLASMRTNVTIQDDLKKVYGKTSLAMAHI